jgi:hypothetical protein
MICTCPQVVKTDHECGLSERHSGTTTEDTETTEIVALKWSVGGYTGFVHSRAMPCHFTFGSVPSVVVHEQWTIACGVNLNRLQRLRGVKRIPPINCPLDLDPFPVQD